jgi:hypothetical protein
MSLDWDLGADGRRWTGGGARHNWQLKHSGACPMCGGYDVWWELGTSDQVRDSGEYYRRPSYSDAVVEPCPTCRLADRNGAERLTPQEARDILPSEEELLKESGSRVRRRQDGTTDRTAGGRPIPA